MKSVALCEFGDSHDDIIYGQFEFLKKSGFTTHFIGNKALENRLTEYDNIDYRFFLDFDSGQIGNFYQIVKTWRYIRKNAINNIVLNTIEGTPVRNFCIFPFGKRNITGIIHNAGNLLSESTTFKKIIIPKIKKMYTLNNYIWKNVGAGLDIENEFVYPLRFPTYNMVISKPKNEFWIIIPGLVESGRRDYIHLLDSIKSESLPKEIKFILLGKSMHPKGIGPKIKQLITEYDLHDNVVMFDDYVDNNTFRSYLDNADLLATLIHPGKGNFDNYSTNKTSGTFLLSFAHKLPMLNHEYFMSYDDINISSVFYNMNNFAETVKNVFFNREQIIHIKDEMSKNLNFDFVFNRKKYLKLLADDE